MQTSIYDIKGKVKGKITIPKIFSVAVRKDLIEKAVLAERSRKRQPYGSDPLAGKRTSAHYHGRRSIRWSMMNREMARTKRIHNQGGLNYTARFVPQATKGRKAHPPKAEKKWKLKINKKSKRNRGQLRGGTTQQRIALNTPPSTTGGVNIGGG